MMSLPKLVQVLTELNTKTLEAELGESFPLLLLVQGEDHVICCSNMEEEARIKALEVLLDGWKAEREAATRPVASMLPRPRTLQ